MPVFRRTGFGNNVTTYNFDTTEGRQKLADMMQQVGLPSDATSFLFAFVHPDSSDRILVLLGHPTPQQIGEALMSAQFPRKLVIAQQEMHITGTSYGTSYSLWDFQGPLRTFPNTTSLSQALGLAAEASEMRPVVALPEASPSRPPETPLATSAFGGGPLLLSTVLAAGLLDGINPCAFAVILLLVALLFTLRYARGRVMLLGGAYVGAVYVTYFLIGLGLLAAASAISAQAHPVARLGSALVIAMGLVKLKDSFWPDLPVHFRMPGWAHGRVKELVSRATIPAVLVAGGLVGLCTLPCAGGVYVSIITMLSAKATALQGVGYLALYNLAFIAPLVGVLALVTNRPTAKALASWERGHSQTASLLYGVAMIGLGLALLFWVL